MRAGRAARAAMVVTLLVAGGLGVARAAGRGAGTHATSAAALDALIVAAPGLDPRVLRLAVDAGGCAVRQGLATDARLLTVIDYSRPSTEPRLWVLDVAAGRLLFHEPVAHGRNSGENETTRFSNLPGSLQTSLGVFVTADTYVGRNGYSLRLAGLEPGINDRALERAIVMHGAPYVSAATAQGLGRLGRSWGCPALRPAIARQLIDTIKGGTVVFAYYPDANWLRASRFLSACSAGARVDDTQP